MSFEAAADGGTAGILGQTVPKGDAGAELTLVASEPGVDGAKVDGRFSVTFVKASQYLISSCTQSKSTRSNLRVTGMFFSISPRRVDGWLDGKRSSFYENSRSALAALKRPAEVWLTLVNE